MSGDAHRGHKRLMRAAWLTGGVIALPYVLPAIGIGSAKVAGQVSNLCTASGSTSMGLAGALNNVLADVPGIGPSLAAGGWSSALWAGGIGFGGMLLGNYVHKHYDHEGGIQWGKIIKYAALTTSLLIGLPSLLTGITMGLTYLAYLAGHALVGNGASFASPVAGALGNTLGFSGATSAVGSAGGLVPHLITCGAVTLPMTGAAFMANKGDRQEKHTQTTTTRWTTRVTQQASQIEALPSLA